MSASSCCPHAGKGGWLRGGNKGVKREPMKPNRGGGAFQEAGPSILSGIGKVEKQVSLTGKEEDGKEKGSRKCRICVGRASSSRLQK